MDEKQYKYKRKDFGELPIKLDHLTIYINLLDDFVEASNILHMTAKQPLQTIELDARELTILNVEWVENVKGGDRFSSLKYNYLEAKAKLVVDLPHEVKTGEQFRIRTVTRCMPSDHVLEGIYKDLTPPGAPQQYISQCQQWGFQRIMPIFDDCRAKCTMTTTLEADAAYTHLISNGNISKTTNPEGKTVPKPGDPGRQIITYENSIPMAPYLFIACAGTWDSLVDHVTYESGRSVRLEYLVPPGRVPNAALPMEILKQSVLWIRRTQDYEYTGDTYRTICMNKSNFGGMENVGNTTIVTDAALIDEHTLDQLLMYAHAVIVHEFEHNQCGSETTMETPFDVWLNEAYTVDVERTFMADVFDPAFVRLTQVDSIRNPLLGPLAVEDGGYAGKIVRDGFNDPDELIDAVTYVKAAEVIRMLRLILGPDLFKAGKALYFSRYKHSNANTDQFFECFEESSGRSLKEFKESWLERAGYPNVVASTNYDPEKKTFAIDFRQDSKADDCFLIPIDVALVNANGDLIPGTDRIFNLTTGADSLKFQNLEETPAFASLNRDYSFYGTFREETATPETFRLKARRDPNLFNRVEAMRQLTDHQRIALITGQTSEIDPDWLSIYGEILADRELAAGSKAYFLRIDEQPLDRNYITWYPELVRARERLMAEVNRAYRKELVDAFFSLDTYAPRTSPKDGIEERILKHVLLDLIACDDTPESHKIILDHYHSATTAQDRVSALSALNRSSAHERKPLLEEVYRAWHHHISGYANYLRIVSSGTCDDVFDMIEAEKARQSFEITNPTWCRSLFLTMAANTKMIWKDEGIAWLTATTIEVAALNPFVASKLLNVFQHARRLKPDLKAKAMAALKRILDEVPEAVSPTVNGQAKAYLS